MAKRVVISHFFNEAYLLPWWLKHHREMFDHGVLIDWSSTDGSADICRQLAPSWEVVPSENAHFAAILCDFEVMKHEARFPDAWKIALNTTEFLVAPALAHMEATLERHELTAVRLPGPRLSPEQAEVAFPTGEASGPPPGWVARTSRPPRPAHEPGC